MRSGQPSEHSFCVIRYIEAVEYGAGWVPSHYVVYNGFGKQVIDLTIGACDGFGKPMFSVASGVTDESSYESDEHSCSVRDSISYFEGHVSHIKNESSACGESNPYIHNLSSLSGSKYDKYYCFMPKSLLSSR